MDKQTIQKRKEELLKKQGAIANKKAINLNAVNYVKTKLEDLTDEKCQMLSSVGINVSILKAVDVDRLVTDKEYSESVKSMYAQLDSALERFIEEGLKSNEGIL